jgi:hypothetical protein
MPALLSIGYVHISVWTFIVILIEPLMHFFYMLLRNRNSELSA